MIIYQAYNEATQSFYIGKTVKGLLHRQRQHNIESQLNRNNSFFHKAIRKYGFDLFQWKILDRAKSKADLAEKERYWIKLFKDAGARLYNLTEGGDGGCTNSYWKGKSIPEETKQKVSLGLKKYFATHINPNKGRTCLGKPHTKESIEKIRLSKLGIPRSEECKAKLSEANLGKKLKPHVIKILKDKFSGANNPSAKSVICLTTGERFEYAKLAAIKYGLDLSSIIKCCKKKIEHTKNMQFEYSVYPAGWRKK